MWVRSSVFAGSVETPGECGARLAAASRQRIPMTIGGPGGTIAVDDSGVVSFTVTQKLFSPVDIPDWMRLVGRAAARAAALRDPDSIICGLDELEGDADDDEDEDDRAGGDEDEGVA